MPTLTCRSCGAVISGDTLQALTTAVQDHARQHGHARPITAEHIRTRLEHEARDENQNDESGG